VSQLLSELAVTSCSFFLSNVQCVHIAAGRRIQAGDATPLTNGMINETLQQFVPFSEILQGSVATHLTSSETFSDGIIANFLLILTVKQFRISVNI